MCLLSNESPLLRSPPKHWPNRLTNNDIRGSDTATATEWGRRTHMQGRRSNIYRNGSWDGYLSKIIDTAGYLKEIWRRNQTPHSVRRWPVVFGSGTKKRLRAGNQAHQGRGLKFWLRGINAAVQDDGRHEINREMPDERCRFSAWGLQVCPRSLPIFRRRRGNAGISHAPGTIPAAAAAG